jgi:hypothetical protein
MAQVFLIATEEVQLPLFAFSLLHNMESRDIDYFLNATSSPSDGQTEE